MIILLCYFLGPFMPYTDTDEDEYDREIAAMKSQGESEEEINAPGPCTSFVIQDPENKVWAGRNLDWNFPGSVFL